MGEHAAIAANAKRHKKKFSTIKKNHIIFHGSGVPDLIYYATQQNVEMKEAKGGKGQLGERWDYLKKKRVKQCTMTYNKTIAKLLIKSNYKGRHPTVGCSAHKNAPIGGCKNCKLAEKKHRRTVGKRMTLAIANGKKFQKVVVRGDYTKTCMKAPKVENAYNGKGAPIPVW